MTGILKVDTIQKNDGAAATVIDLGINVSGTIVQTVTTNYFASSAVGFGGASYSAGPSLSITPKFSNSKILLNFWARTNMNNGGSSAGQDHIFQRNGTTIAGGSWDNYLNRSHYQADFYPNFIQTFYDQPNTTSQVTYTLLGRIYGGSNASWTIFTRNANSALGNDITGCWTLMEIAG